MEKPSDLNAIVTNWAKLQDELEAEAREKAASMRAAFDVDAPSAVELIERRQEAQAKAEIARLNVEIAHTRAEVEAILASKSWRVTAPLRAVRRWIGL